MATVPQPPREPIDGMGPLFTIQRADRYAFELRFNDRMIGSVQVPTPCAPGYRGTLYKFAVEIPRHKYGTLRFAGFGEALESVTMRFLSNHIVWC